MADVLGATGESNARVFGCFFLGLSLGAAVASLLLPRLSRPWRMAGFAELGIGLLSLPALSVNYWSAPIWPALGPEKLLSWQGALVKSVLSVVIVLPPACLVGMTLPLLTAAVLRAEKQGSFPGIWLYAVYTLGGALGIAAVIGLAVQQLGATGSMLLIAGMNLLAGGICLARDVLTLSPSTAPSLSRSDDAPPLPRSDAPTLSRSDAFWPLPARLLLCLSFLSGAAVLATEVLGLQLLKLKAPVALYTPAIVIFSIVLLLGCSAQLVAAALNFFKTPGRALIFSSAVAGITTSLAPLLFLGFTAGRNGLGIHCSSLPIAWLQLVGAT